MAPGNDKRVIETPVREDHKARWPAKWLAWQMREGLIEGAAADVPGWPLKDWPELNEQQRRELEYLRFSTVEQLAGASDGQIQRLGLRIIVHGDGLLPHIAMIRGCETDLENSLQKFLREWRFKFRNVWATL